MANFKVGDRVKVCARPDWVKDPGYPLEGTEGVVVQVGAPDGFVEIYVEKTTAPINTETRITLKDTAIQII